MLDHWKGRESRNAGATEQSKHYNRKHKSDFSEAMHYKCVPVIRKFIAYHLNQIFLCCEAYDNQDRDNFTENSMHAQCLSFRELAADNTKPNHQSDKGQSLYV